MALVKPDYRLGRIIITSELIGRNGKREEHAAVIISPDAEIIQPADFDPRQGKGLIRENLVAVLGISSQYAKFNDPYVKLPAGPATGLTRDCAVILNWFGVLHLDEDVDFLLRDVPPTLMIEVNAKYREVLSSKLGKLMGTVVQSLGRLEGR